MIGANWRSKLDDQVRRHLELQVRAAHTQRKAYRLSRNPSNAQLWVAISNLSRQLFELNLRTNMLERTIKDIIERELRKKGNFNHKITKKKVLKKRGKI